MANDSWIKASQGEFPDPEDGDASIYLYIIAAVMQLVVELRQLALQLNNKL